MKLVIGTTLLLIVIGLTLFGLNIYTEGVLLRVALILGSYMTTPQGLTALIFGIIILAISKIDLL